MTRPVLVLQHAPWEGPGLIGRALSGIPLQVRTVVDLPRPDLPAAPALAGLVVMGGPQSADDEDAHPGLAAERRLIAEAVAAGVPVLGICLGMQMLAMALGAPLDRGHGTEIGFAPVDVLAQDAALGPLGPKPTVLHWHSDAVDLPVGATLLASSPVTGVQAFRAGSALGLQFHVEVDQGLLDSWLATPAMGGTLDPARARAIRDAAADVLPALLPRALAGLATFADAVEARR